MPPPIRTNILFSLYHRMEENAIVSSDFFVFFKRKAIYRFSSVRLDLEDHLQKNIRKKGDFVLLFRDGCAILYRISEFLGRIAV